jgi:hypothetical protein
MHIKNLYNECIANYPTRQINLKEKRNKEELVGLDIFDGDEFKRKNRFSPIVRIDPDGFAKPRYRGRTITPCKKDPIVWQSGLSENPFEVLALEKEEEEDEDEDSISEVEYEPIVKKKQPKKRKKEEETAEVQSDEENTKKKRKKEKKEEEVSESTEVKSDEETTLTEKKKPKKKARGNTAAFGLKALNSILPKKGVVKKRQMKPTTSESKRLGKLHEMNVWEVGVLECKLRNGQEKLDEFGKHMLKAIRACVETVNNIFRRCQKASLFLVEHLMERPAIYYLLQELITNGKADDGGQQFWTALMQLLYSGESMSPNVLIRYFKALPEFKRFLVPAKEKIDLNGSYYNLIQNNAKTLAASFRGQIIGKLPLLIAQILEETDHKDLPETRASIESILTYSCSKMDKDSLEKYMQDQGNQIETGDDANEFEGDEANEFVKMGDEANEFVDAVYKFVRINQMLSNPWKVVPQSSVTDCSILITEASLLPLLDPVLLQSKTSIRKSHSTLPSWLKSGKLNQPQGHFWRVLFGPTLGGKFKYCTVDEHLKPSADEAGLRKFQYVLSTTIRTNGLDLDCLVYNLNRPAKRPAQASQKTIMEQAASLRRRKRVKGSEIPDLNPDQSKNLKIIGIDFGEVNAAGVVCKDMDSYFQDEVESTDQVDDEFESTDQVDDEVESADQVDDDPDETKDEMEGNDGTDIKENNQKKLNYKEKGNIVNLKIKTSALSEPTRLYRNWLNVSFY